MPGGALIALAPRGWEFGWRLRPWLAPNGPIPRWLFWLVRGGFGVWLAVGVTRHLGA